MLTTALVIGVVVSRILTELIGLTPGGIIVPGYVAMLLDRPAALAAFVIIALLTYGFVRALSSHLMLYGSRRFTVTVLIGLTLAAGAQWIGPNLNVPYVEWAGLGFIVPGLLAHQFDRQGIVPTLLVLAIAAPLVRILVLVVVQW